MTEPLLYRPTDEEARAFVIAWAREKQEHPYAAVIALEQAQREGKRAFNMYLAIARSL